MDKTLHVYADEIGDIGPFNERSPIYALSLIFVDEATDRSKGLSALKREEKRFGLCIKNIKVCQIVNRFLIPPCQELFSCEK